MIRHRDNHGDDESGDFGLESMGILFEGLHPTTTKGFLWESPFDHGTDAFIADDGVASIDWERRRTRRNEAKEHHQHSSTSTSTSTAHASNNNSKSNISNRKNHAKIICAVVRCIDDHPGAVASGHYVWPSSLLLCDYLVAAIVPHPDRGTLHNSSTKYQFATPSDENFGGLGINGNNSVLQAISSNMDDTTTTTTTTTESVTATKSIHLIGPTTIRSVLELGSGSGILSIVASQIFGDTLEVVVVTDHDPSTLERARENHQTTMTTIRRSTSGANPTKSAAVRTEFLDLEWGSLSEWQSLQKCLHTHENELAPHRQGRQSQLQEECFFDLILGSDLIDCMEVVEPLFWTVDAALEKHNRSNKNENSTRATATPMAKATPTPTGVFLVSQSFGYDSETEAAIDRACGRFGFVRRVLVPHKFVVPGGSTGGSNGVSFSDSTKIQEFRRLPK